ncbi:hypothetical protein DES40_1431 [Litorimonas taeanensis]|uniref:GIY-YIG domain-containing protein n=1 Tax=Litorimonas taeanensis TaxID=568099 RepID=A0A420WM40_9PROT|nr:GIY-YIG nuclease family protein [Litorimonas taeanensis]RKQ72094.1 hypothetical protein DES40_1431 [Litorimonas taeanensis]
MSAIDRVKSLHLKPNSFPICDDCIAVKAKLSSRQESNIISRKLIQTTRFDRRKDYCGSCGGLKYVMFANKMGRSVIQKRPKEVARPRELSQIKPASTKTYFGENRERNIDLLKEIGFVSIGYWQDNNGEPELIQNDMHDASPALYAFVECGQVLYVGKTKQNLKKRLYFYSKPGVSQATNIRINANLKAALFDGREIDMYGFNDVRPMKVGAFYLNFSAALEDSIIDTLKPKWNLR